VTPRPCGGQIGFLAPRACPNAAVGDCSKCGRAVCEEHCHVAGDGLLCRHCETGSELPSTLAGLAAAAALVPLFTPSDIGAFEAAADEEPLAEADTFADLS
jgi:recombinational DNA repair protein (RecF pathway)